jgi:rhodanese-related sulfurtransferase
MKKLSIICAAFLGLALPVLAGATDFNFVSAGELKAWLAAGKPMLLVDIQEQQDFAAHHLKGSLETNAYPVESEAERTLLAPALELNRTNEYAAVVVVCPRGKGGAKRANEFLRDQGVPEAKLFILSGGMDKWPHPEWVEAK